MRRFLLATAAALPIVIVAAGAQERAEAQQAPSCIEWPLAMKAAQAGNPDAELVRVMEGNLAHDFVTIVNQLPPVSSFDGDHVALFFKKTDDQFLVVIGQDHCARHVVELPAAAFAQMIGQEA
jgi:hypothetical protein